MSQSKETYESVVLGILVYEFPSSKRTEADEKIQKTLKRKKLGDIDLGRIEKLRKLKNELQEEVNKQKESNYYIRPQTPEFEKKYVEVTDFDIPRMTAYFIKRYPSIAKKEIQSFVPFAIFVYHLL